MAEKQKKASLLGSTSCISESNNENFMPRKRLSADREDLWRRLPLSKLAAQNRMDDTEFRDPVECVPAIGLTIGGYSCFTGKDVSVSAWFSYQFKRVYWEIVEGPLKRRLSLVWDAINGLDLKLNECGLACLTVEVNRLPSFLLYMPESEQWTPIKDFTDGEIKRNLPPHCVVFKPGTVNESYEKLSNYRKQLAIVRAEHTQWFLKTMLPRKEQAIRRQERAKLREKKLQQILESKLHRQLGKLSISESEKEENKRAQAG